jgi:uncharacterized protein
MKIGIISDTHGHLDPQVHDVFAGVAAIVHAGDIGGVDILFELESIAVTYAVLGNCDYAVYGPTVRPVLSPTLGGRRFKIVHRPKDIGVVEADTSVVVCGHTHKAVIEDRGTFLYLNPGSASEPRDGASPSVMILDLENNGTLAAQIVRL